MCMSTTGAVLGLRVNPNGFACCSDVASLNDNKCQQLSNTILLFDPSSSRRDFTMFHCHSHSLRNDKKMTPVEHVSKPICTRIEFRIIEWLVPQTVFLLLLFPIFFSNETIHAFTNTRNTQNDPLEIPSRTKRITIIIIESWFRVDFCRVKHEIVPRRHRRRLLHTHTHTQHSSVAVLIGAVFVLRLLHLSHSLPSTNPYEAIRLYLLRMIEFQIVRVVERAQQYPPLQTSETKSNSWPQHQQRNASKTE